MKNILIAGGAGFIGSALVRRLIEAPENHVIVYDNMTSGSRALLPVAPNLTIITGDIKNTRGLRSAMGGCHEVWHLAANPDIARAVTEPDIDFREGTQLTQNILEAMRLTGAGRLFYASGSGVYGESSIVFREDFGPMLPISTYGASKLAGETLICSYCHMFGITARAFRFANVVGPRQTHGIGYDFIRRLRADPSNLKILGDGSQTKSYLHVDDALEAALLVAGLAQSGYEVFNVASADCISVAQIVEIAKEVVFHCFPTRAIPLEYTGGDRGWKGDVPVARLDCTKIRSLGWKPFWHSSEAMFLAMTAINKETCTT